MDEQNGAGCYQLLAVLNETKKLRIGSLGVFEFPAGFYIYTGRAKRHMTARIARHKRRDKAVRWHIDYLLRHARVIDVRTFPFENTMECMLAAAALDLPQARLVAPRFGASDCRCPAHLVFYRERPWG